MDFILEFISKSDFNGFGGNGGSSSSSPKVKKPESLSKSNSNVDLSSKIDEGIILDRIEIELTSPPESYSSRGSSKSNLAEVFYNNSSLEELESTNVMNLSFLQEALLGTNPHNISMENLEYVLYSLNPREFLGILNLENGETWLPNGYILDYIRTQQGYIDNRTSASTFWMLNPEEMKAWNFICYLGDGELR
jgi:hypothetical protein